MLSESRWVYNKKEGLKWVIFPAFIGFVIIMIYQLMIYFNLPTELSMVIIFLTWAWLFDGTHSFATYTRTYFDKSYYKNNKGFLLKSLLLPFLFLFILSCISDDLTERSEKNENLTLNKSNTVSTIDPPPNLPNDFLWGINGHPAKYDGGVYLTSRGLQKTLIKEHQFDIYRISLGIKADGSLRFDSDEIAYNDYLNSFADMPDLKVLCVPLVHHLIDYSPSATQAQNYIKGKTLGEGFMKTTNNRFKYVGLGNEIVLWDDLLINNPPTYGVNSSDYNISKLNKAAAFLRGMQYAFDNEPNGPETVLLTTRTKFYFIEHMVNEGVNFDIMGYHMYTKQEQNGEYITLNTPLNHLGGQTILGYIENNMPPKDVWITEAGLDGGANTPAQQKEQSEIADLLIKELSGTSKVKAYFHYELLDNYQNVITQRYYGIMDWNASTGVYEHKPISETLKFRIEENKRGYQNYIYSLYQNVAGRNPSALENDYLTNVSQLSATDDFTSSVNTIMYNEGYREFVRYNMEFLIDRVNYTSDINFLENQMQNNILNRENIIKYFCASNAFWLLSNQDNETFVERLFEKLLDNVNPSSQDVRYYLNQLNSGESRLNVVIEFMESEKYIRKFIRDQYIDLLDRNLDNDSPSEDFWYTEMTTKQQTQNEVIKHLLKTKGYWILSNIKGYERNNSPFTYYN